MILAAGKGTRMKSDLPKTMLPIAGRPLLSYVLDTARSIPHEKTIVVVGHKKETIMDEFRDTGVEFVTQEPQLGTGHAVAQAEKALSGFDGDVIILSGDVPLLKPETIKSLLELHRQNNASITVLTFEPEDPGSYGRIIRDGARIIANVEAKDATDEQLKIREVNSGVYVFKSSFLFPYLHRVDNQNAQAEFYLTDLINLAAKEGLTVCGMKTGELCEVMGANTPEDLKALEKALA